MTSRTPMTSQPQLSSLVIAAFAALAFSAGPAPVAVARQVPVDEPGSTQTTQPDPDSCTGWEIDSCLDQWGGIAIWNGERSDCECLYFEWIPRQITNAKKGDAGITPMNDAGDPVVRAALEAVGQMHQHALMFFDYGRQTRHNTMLTTSDYMGVIVPGRTRLNPDDLRNGLPGAITQTIDDAFALGRMVDEGLLLKPMYESISHATMRATVNAAGQTTYTSTGETVTTDYRALFGDAVDEAIATPAYYKLSDYTRQTSMTKPWSSSRLGDLRGSHCSGFVRNFYQEIAPIPTVHYDEEQRRDVGEAVFDAARAQVEGRLEEDWGVLAIFVPNAADNIANQTANCLAGLNCDITDDNWSVVGGEGDANAPDNLLPLSFLLRGSGEYEWGDEQVDAGERIENASGVETTPFERVEPQVVAGGYSVLRTKKDW